MVRPDGWSPSSTTNSMTHEFTRPSPLHRQASVSSHQSASQAILSFGTSFDTTHDPSQTSIELKSGQHLPNPPVHISQSFSRRTPQDLQQTGTHSQDFAIDAAVFPTIRHASKPLFQGPWNPYELGTTPGNLTPDNVLDDLRQNKIKLHTDSGYASSQLSHQPPNTSTPSIHIFDSSNGHVYDEPIGTAAQQNIYLPDQQHKRPSLKPPSSIAPSVTADSATLNSQSFRCPHCPEVFNTKSEMSKHNARHLKIFICDHPNCSRATDGFATKNDLDRHKASVHQDDNVCRKKFKCSVPGCKDPSKIWVRKDNFKAHVKRMHPDADADTVVEQSFQGESTPSNEAPLSATAGHNDEFTAHHYMPTSQNMLFQPNTAIDTSFADHTAWPEEGDLYDPSNPLSMRHPSYFQLDVSPSQGQRHSQNPNIAPSATYASSQTIAGANNQMEQMPLFPHRQNHMPVAFSSSYHDQNYMPSAAHTAPVIGHTTDDYQSHVPDWSQTFDTASIMDQNITPIDPVLQTLRVGSWQPPSSNNYPQHPDILNQSLQTSIQASSDEQSPVASTISPRDHIKKQIDELIESLPPEDKKSVLEEYQKDLDLLSPSKHTFVAKANLDAKPKVEERLFECSRDGCSKLFKQNNIRTKHEKRHDRLFFCTFDGCYSTFGSKDDLKRHEVRKHRLQAFEGWRCFTDDVRTSQHRPECHKFFTDENRFKQHRREEHKERGAVNNGGLKALKSCHVLQGSPGQFWCGFCQKAIPNDDLDGTDGTKPDKFRYDHIDNHITKAKKTISDWVDLRSGGLTKTQVMDASHNEKSEESEDGEDRDEMSPETSTSPLTPTVMVTAPTSQTARQDLGNTTTKKRARSVAGYDISPVKVQRSFLQQTSGQAFAMSRGSSEATRPMYLRPEVQQRQQIPIVAMTCCRCTTSRPASSGLLCVAHGCGHRWCQNCECIDDSGIRRNIHPPRPHPGQRGPVA